MKIKKSVGRRIFDICNVTFMILLACVMIYPIWYVIVASFSNSNLLMQYDGFLVKPLGFELGAYKLMMRNPMILRGYANTIGVVVVGVIFNLIFTTIGAYFLSRENVYWSKYAMMLIVITMFFSGGMIPKYLIVTQTFGMYNSYWALIIPILINTYNLIIMRTSLMAIPKSVCEAATIDGAGHLRTLWSIVVPMAKPVIAVMVLYYAVNHWNSWFQASIYLKDREKFPLQLILREILISNDTESMTQGSNAADQLSIAESVKYATIVVSTVPILCVYPFLQKYFAKGVLIGAVKG